MIPINQAIKHPASGKYRCFHFEFFSGFGTLYENLAFGTVYWNISVPNDVIGNFLDRFTPVNEADMNYLQSSKHFCVGIGNLKKQVLTKSPKCNKSHQFSLTKEQKEEELITIVTCPLKDSSFTCCTWIKYINIHFVP